MKAWTKRLSILLVCQLLLAGGLWAFNRKSHSPTPLRSLLSFQDADVTKIEISGGGKTVVLTKSGDGWLLPQYHELPAASERVENLLTRLKELEVAEPETTTTASHQRMGVAEEAADNRIRLFRADELISDLMLGKSPGMNSRFVRKAGENEVYRVSWSGLASQVAGQAWMDTGLISSGPVREFRHNALHLVQTDGEWVSGETKLDQEKAADFVGRLENLQVTKVAEKPDSVALLEITVQTEKNQTLIYSIFEKSGDFIIRRHDHPNYFQIPQRTFQALLRTSLNSLEVPGSPAGDIKNSPAVDKD